MVSYASSCTLAAAPVRERFFVLADCCWPSAARNFGEIFRVHTASPASGYMGEKEENHIGSAYTVIAQLFRHDSSHVFRFFLFKNFVLFSQIAYSLHRLTVPAMLFAQRNRN